MTRLKGRQRHRQPSKYVIPPREELEKMTNTDGSVCFEKHELEAFDEYRPILQAVSHDDTRRQLGRAFLRQLWQTEELWIAKTHWITVKDWRETKASGPIVQLRWNYMQKKLHGIIEDYRRERLPIRVRILKARQLGSSTFAQSWLYEQADRDQQYYAMTLSFDDEGTEYLFEKCKFIHDHMWFPHDLDRHAGKIIKFVQPHGSALTCQTAGNESAGSGRTIHGLHTSETAKWTNPEPVMLSVGQTQADSPGTAHFDETTALGAQGMFYEDWRLAERGESDYYPFFAPWYWDPAYQQQFADGDQRRAFGRSLNAHEREIKTQHNLTLEQLRWRRWTIRNKCGGSLRKFDQEYPITANVAFMTTGSPVFDPVRVQQLYDNTTDPYFVGEVVCQR